MKMRKLFAGVAAVATLLGGMAFGAAANAVDAQYVAPVTLAADPGSAAAGDNVITIHVNDAKQIINRRTFKYVKVANYNTGKLNDGTDGTYLTSAADQNAIRAALTAAGIQNVPTDVDPMTWLGTQNLANLGADWAKFSESLAGNKNLLVDYEGGFDGSDATNLKFHFTDPGLYLLVDQSGAYVDNTNAACPVTYTQFKPILVGTALTGVNDQDGNTVNGSVTAELGTGTVFQKQTNTTNCTGDFNLNKVNAKGDKIGGAEFQVTIDGKTVYFTKNDNGSYTYAGVLDEGAAVPEGKYVTLTTVDGQTLVVKGLPAGTYTVTETKVPEGYLESGPVGVGSLKPSFTVTVDGQTGVVTVSTDKNGDPNDQVSGENSNTATVKNFKNITELPQTGAAGIAMFTVIGLLLAGAAGTVYLRSRRTKAMLNA